MNFFSTEEDHQQPDGRIDVKLVRNGNPTKIYPAKLKRNMNHEQICDEIARALDLKSNKNIRIFRHGGVEVMEDETKYLIDGDMLYISRGEDFDDSSNFAVYQVTRTLGQGGYGKVVEATHALTKELILIKKKRNAESANDIEMLFKEVQSLKALNHKNIVKILNCFYLREDESFAIVLEYLDGGDLRKYINERGFLEEQECQNIFTQIFDAINYCHRNRVIHRDLKLENLMFVDSEKKTIRVVDFGIAGSDSKITVDQTNAGSIRYLTPEVIISRHPAHPGIDVWAMGVILYWMLSGHPPFEGNTRQDIIDKILKADYSFDRDMKRRTTRAVRDIIQRMLTIDLKERIDMKDIHDHIWMNKTVAEIIDLEQLEDDQEKEYQRIRREEERAQLAERGGKAGTRGPRFSLLKSKTQADKQYQQLQRAGSIESNGRHMVPRPYLQRQGTIQTTQVNAGNVSLAQIVAQQQNVASQVFVSTQPSVQRNSYLQPTQSTRNRQNSEEPKKPAARKKSPDVQNGQK